jgi:heme oxygenase
MSGESAVGAFGRGGVDAGVSLMTALRTGTAAQHASAEGKALQQRMVRGQISRTEYVAWLGQLVHVHAAIEQGVHVAKNLRGGEVLSVIGPAHQHTARLKSDLEFLGGGTVTEVGASAATRALVAEVENSAGSNAARLFGMWYVLEGSMNGNVYIARAVAKGLGLNGDDGLSYLSSYGARQREVWAEFRASADAVAVEASAIEDAVGGAKRMFEGIGAMSDEILE